MDICQEPDLTQLDAYDYELDEALIARYPSAERGDSRLLVVERNELMDMHFSAFPKLLEPGDCLVINTSRVMHARLWGYKVSSGGRVQVLFERILSEKRALGLIHASNPPRAGARLRLADAFEVEVLERKGELYELQLVDHKGNLAELIERFGELPLPPYLMRQPEASDEVRYQTVYAGELGSVAAPTAGLHFTEALLAELTAAGVRIAPITLHVGAGTFLPVRSKELAQHRMHSERFELSEASVEKIEQARAEGKRVVAVGTTVVRALEGAYRAHGALLPGQGETDLFIRPPFRFRVVDALLTNFHLPRSTLVMLVAAFAGYKRTMQAYRHAVAERYRFYSYGDAMFIPAPFGNDAS